jgi:hypothetical protein
MAACTAHECFPLFLEGYLECRGVAMEISTTILLCP